MPASQAPAGDHLSTDQFVGGLPALHRDLGNIGPNLERIWASTVVVVNPDGTPITPGAGGGPTLVARANAAAPAFVEGAAVPLSVDLAGQLRTLGGGGGGGGGVAQLQIRNAGDTAWANVVAGGALRVPVDGSGVTQPISAVALPLPAGATTETTLQAVRDRLPTTLAGGRLDVSIGASPATVPISASSLPLPSGASQEHTTAASPSSTRLSDGAAFYDARSIRTLTSTDAITVANASLSVTGPLTDAQLRATAVPVSGTFWQATQPISAAALPLPAGAATETTLTQVRDRLPTSLGQGLMAASLPVVIASNQSGIPVTGTFWQATQPVSGTFWQATQPVSIAATITVAGGSSDNSANSVAKLPTIVARANAAGPAWTEGNQVPLSVDLSGNLRIRALNAVVDNVAVQGEVAHDAVDTGAPQKIGGKASTVHPTAVAVGDRVNAWLDTIGRLATFTAAQESWIAYADAVAFANAKHHITIFNAVGSGKIVKVRKIFAVNLQTAAIVGIVQRMDVLKCTASSVGTAITAQAMDPANAALPAGVTVRTGATVTVGALLYPWITSSEESVATTPLDKGVYQQAVNIAPEGPEIQEHTITEGNGITVQQNTASTVGTFGWIVVFTVENAA